MDRQGSKRMETERLILRPFVSSDAEDMFRNWCTDTEVTKYLTWPPHRTLEDTRQILERWVADSSDPAVYHWAMEWKASGQVIGSIGVVRQDIKTRCAELGYCIGRAWWGQGLTAEALHPILSYLAREEGFTRLCACHDVENPRSGRVMEKCGMKREGVLRRAGRNNRGIVDMVVYSILPEEIR